MDEALIILEKKIRNDATLSKCTDLSPDEILVLIKECVESPYFQCELGMFMQDDGVPMGGPLSCIIADLFLEDYEEKIDFVINETHINDDWFRYRDDTWLIWEHSLQDLEAFKDYLNSLHSKIKWTYEVEKNGVLNFLDILLKRETDGSFTTTVYQMKTHSDRYLHFSSETKKMLTFYMKNVIYEDWAMTTRKVCFCIYSCYSSSFRVLYRVFCVLLLN